MEYKKTDFDWDDELLIKIYEDGMKNVFDQLGIQEKEESSSKSKKDSLQKRGSNKFKKNIAWEVGDHCQAIFSEDSLPYEAVIKKVNDEELTCVVEYIGYGNEEVVPFKDISPSKGPSARRRQTESMLGGNCWKIGDYCWAIFSEDGQWYEGKIVEAVNSNLFAVKFLYYNNVEDVPVANLAQSTRRSSKDNIYSQEGAGSEESSLCSEHSSMSESSQVSHGNRSSSQAEAEESFRHHSRPHRHRHSSRQAHVRTINSLPSREFYDPFHPPVTDNDEVLSNLLLSWYMAGYNMGYHVGLNTHR